MTEGTREERTPERVKKSAHSSNIKSNVKELIYRRKVEEEEEAKEEGAQGEGAKIWRLDTLNPRGVILKTCI